MERLNANICDYTSSQASIPPFNVFVSERDSGNDPTLKGFATLFPWDHLIWEQYGSTLRLSAPWGRVHGKAIKAVPGTEAITVWWMPWSVRGLVGSWLSRTELFPSPNQENVPIQGVQLKRSPKSEHWLWDSSHIRTRMNLLWGWNKIPN